MAWIFAQVPRQCNSVTRSISSKYPKFMGYFMNLGYDGSTMKRGAQVVTAE